MREFVYKRCRQAWARRRGRLIAWLLFAITPGLSAPSLAQESAQRRAPLPAAEAQHAFTWTPEVAPRGPTSIIVDLRDQRIHVYRNGVRIGLSPISSGRQGFETPPGVYTILEKQRTHFSNLYDDAPMPYMQRLTWSGIALHAGTLPGHPDSHGCIRLPLAFAEKLYDTTARGMTVIVSDAGPSPSLVQPLPLLSAGNRDNSAASERPPPAGLDELPVTLVWSTPARELIVLRNGEVVERGAMGLRGPLRRGTRAWLLLAPLPAGGSQGTDDAGRWMELVLDKNGTTGAPISRADLEVDPTFAVRVRALLRPGTTVVMTDAPLHVEGGTDRPLFDAQSRP